MSVTAKGKNVSSAVTVTSDPDRVWSPLFGLVRALCCSPVCCSVSEHLRRVQGGSQSALESDITSPKPLNAEASAAALKRQVKVQRNREKYHHRAEEDSASSQEAAKTPQIRVAHRMAYLNVPGDVEMGREQRTVVSLGKKSTRLAYMVSGCLLFAALCLVSVRIFTWYRSSGLEVMEELTKAVNMNDTAEKTDQLNDTLSQNSSQTKAAVHLAGCYVENETSRDELEGKNVQGQGFTHSERHNNSMAQPGRTEALYKTDASYKIDRHYMLGRISSKAKAAIHLTANWDNEDKSKLEWSDSQGQAFAQGSFQLDNNKIVIPQTGLYFVYSQASFRVSCSERGEEEGAGKGLTPLSHRIWHSSDYYGAPVLLLSSVRSACQNTAQEDVFGDGQGWYNAIYLGAVFQLNKGDTLWTETNQLSELETDEGRTFFGIFEI